MKMPIDLTINLGNILTVLAFIGGGIYFILVMGHRVDTLSKETSDLKTDLSKETSDLKDQTKYMQQELRKLTEVLIVQGRQDERITAIDQRMVNQGKRLDDAIRRLNTYLDLRAVNIVDEDM